MSSPIKVTSPSPSSNMNSPIIQPVASSGPNISSAPSGPTISPSTPAPSTIGASAPGTIGASVPGASASVPGASAPGSSPSKTIGGIDKKKILMYSGLIILLAFLGFNVFKYLGGATTKITDIFKPILAFFGKGVTKTVGTTVDVGAKGTKGIVDATKNTVDSGLHALEDKMEDKEENEEKNKKVRKDKTPEAAPARSNTKSGGYCYIGSEDGVRSCARVGSKEECMSGDLFSTLQECKDAN